MLKRYIFDDSADVAFNGWQIRNSRMRSFASIPVYGSLGLSPRSKEGLNYSYPNVHITSRTDGRYLLRPIGRSRSILNVDLVYAFHYQWSPVVACTEPVPGTCYP